MANNIAFQAMGKTVKANATVTVQQKQMAVDSPCSQYMLVSHEPTGAGGIPVYVRISNSATGNVALPTNTSAEYAYVVPPDSVMVVTGPTATTSANVFLTFVTESGSGEIYVTPGEGMT
jgi:hypothetical protein